LKVHYRLGIAVVLVMYAIQCVVLLAVAFSPILAIVELFVGAYIVGRFLTTIWRRIATHDDSIEISGFFLGGHKAVVSAEDLVSIRFHSSQQAAWGRPSFDIGVFELHAQTSPNYYPIARFGWSGNRELFRVIASMVDASPITLDHRTQKMLNKAAGV
jgi:hypothetical protein